MSIENNVERPTSELITDQALAWDMAAAAAPYYDDFLSKGRNVTINESLRLGICIGEAFNCTQNHYLGGVACSDPVESVRPDGLELIKPIPNPAEARQTMFLGNVERLRTTITSIFNTIRGTELLSSDPLVEEGSSLLHNESVTLYDPRTGITSIVTQHLHHSSDGLIPVKCEVHDILVPETNEGGKNEPLTGRLLYPGRILEIQADDTYAYTDGSHDMFDVRDKDPNNISSWITRLERAIPVQDAGIVSQKKDRERVWLGEKYTKEGGRLLSMNRERMSDRKLRSALKKAQQRYAQLRK